MKSLAKYLFVRTAMLLASCAFVFAQTAPSVGDTRTQQWNGTGWQSLINYTQTVATLRAYSTTYLSGSERVTTLGQTSVADGFGATYNWNAASVAADDGLNIIKPTASATGRWLIVGLETYGWAVPALNPTGGQFYNTLDQITNYERASFFWLANNFTLAIQNGGTGTARNFFITGGGTTGQLGVYAGQGANGVFGFTSGVNGINGGVGYRFDRSDSLASGAGIGLEVLSTLAQSGTAGYTDIFLNRVANAVGSGTQRLIDLQVLGVSQFRVDTGGNMTAVGSISAGGGLQTNNATVGFGYAAGAGGAVTQLTSRSTAVTLNKVSGAITLFSSAGIVTATTFTVNNSTVAATDVIDIVEKSGTNLYEIFVTAVAAGSFNVTFLTTGGVATDSPVFSFAVIKAVNS